MTIHSDPQLNDADLELLSAYIDRQLGDGERAALERRLSQEPALRSALDELRATVALLHDLEPLKPPRSFAIAAPAVAPRRIWSFSLPAIGSALVALVCLLTFGYALIRSSSGSGGQAASGPPPAAMQEAAAPTAAAAAAGGAPNSAMREAATEAPAPAAAAPMAAPAAAAPTAAAAAEAPVAAAEQATAAPAAAASMAAPADATAAPAADASTPTPAPTMMPAAGAGAIATTEPAAPALPQAADSATSAQATPAAGAAPKTTDATVQQPYSALVATSEISSPGTITLEQPPVAPAANTAPSSGLNSLGLVAGAVVLALLIGAGVWFARRRKRR